MKPCCKSEARWKYWRDEGKLHDKFTRFDKQQMQRARRRHDGRLAKEEVNHVDVRRPRSIAQQLKELGFKPKPPHLREPPGRWVSLPGVDDEQDTNAIQK